MPRSATSAAPPAMTRPPIAAVAGRRRSRGHEAAFRRQHDQSVHQTLRVSRSAACLEKVPHAGHRLHAEKADESRANGTVDASQITRQAVWIVIEPLAEPELRA